jgi:hypothetical protein
MLHEHVTTYGNRFDPESYVFTTPRRHPDRRCVVKLSN